MGENKTENQFEMLRNRLAKRYKHLKKWAARTDVSCFRIYDKDIPEIPLAIDLYQSLDGEKYLQIALYERPYEKDEREENDWLNKMKEAVAEIIGVEEKNIFTKVRKHQKEKAQYEKNDGTEKSKRITVAEQGAKFFVDLSTYLDTGLFFDHRPLRKIVQKECGGKRVLNLYCYTGAFSVYAALGNVKHVDSVDLSKTYINWAKENFTLNALNPANTDKYGFHCMDTTAFLDGAIDKGREKWDIIILDPPTFSNSKKTEGILDINRDWSDLVNKCVKLLDKNGTLYFSTNSRRLKFAPEKIIGYYSNLVEVLDITQKTIPEDFRNEKIHVCWKISKGSL